VDVACGGLPGRLVIEGRRLMVQGRRCRASLCLALQRVHWTMKRSPWATMSRAARRRSRPWVRTPRPRVLHPAQAHVRLSGVYVQPLRAHAGCARRHLCPCGLCVEAQQAQVLLREGGRASGGARLPRALPRTAKAAIVIVGFSTDVRQDGPRHAQPACTEIAPVHVFNGWSGAGAGRGAPSAPIASADAVCGEVRGALPRGA
jgi:hypothetical protein